MIEAIIQEVILQADYLENIPIETIYFGGGTPSLLNADDINRIADTIYQHYKITHDGIKEFTLETNPDDLTKAYVQSLQHSPVSRFSIGIQSFKDEDLRYMNRAHNAQEADYAIKTAQDAGFSNLTIDLIYGTPGLTDTDWKHNLSKVKELDIPHFSAYALTVEEGTALHSNIQKKKTTPVDIEQAAGQFEILIENADVMGYEQYEISNFAKPGKYAIHNTNYWKGISYLGVGPSAHSFNGTTRQWNIANNALYLKSILQDRKVPAEIETLTKEQRLNEYIMTSLRTMWGCDINKLGDYTSIVMQQAKPYIEKGEIVQKDNMLVLSISGKLIADKIASDLFV
jgi:oxygen-independent coproporphyrinogen-3 oxidase